jgi:hypothetical protein
VRAITPVEPDTDAEAVRLGRADTANVRVVDRPVGTMSFFRVGELFKHQLKRGRPVF